MTVIRCKKLTKRFGNVVAVRDLAFEVHEGEVFGFLGPNGAGKTTTISMLLDSVKPSAGSATILGYDTQKETKAVHRHVGVLPEGYSLYDRLSGRRHVRFAIRSKGSDEEPMALIERVGLDSAAADRPTAGYSKGMQQRLALAMALAGDPEVLVLDEPSSGLDPNGIQDVQNLIRAEAAAGTTVFFSSHILPHVEAVCDRVGIMNDGVLSTVDTLDGLRETANLGYRFTIDVEGEPEIDLTEFEAVTDATVRDGHIEVRCTDPQAKVTIIDRLEAAGVTVLDFDIEDASLEDLFAAHTDTTMDDIQRDVEREA